MHILSSIISDKYSRNIEIQASLDDFSPEGNPKLVAEYTAFLKENLTGIDDKRGYMYVN